MLQVLANVGRKEKLKSIIKSTGGKKSHKYNCTIERPKVLSKSIRFKILQTDCRVLWTGETNVFKHINRSRTGEIPTKTQFLTNLKSCY